MTAVLIETEKVETPVGHDNGDDGLMHVICLICWRNFCDGEHCPDCELDEPGAYPNDCLVCDDLDEVLTACPHCGASTSD